MQETTETTSPPVYHRLLAAPLVAIAIMVAALIAMTTNSFSSTNLGINATLFIGVFIFGATLLARQIESDKRQVNIWFSPLYLVAAGYALYENFFLEGCNYL
jgi:hypothetical protein